MSVKIRFKDGNLFCDGRMQVTATKELHHTTGKPVYAFTGLDKWKYTIECTECVEIIDP